MDGIDTGALLTALMQAPASSAKAAAPMNLDAQLLAALKQPAPSLGAPIDPDSPQAYARAAATAAAQEDATPQTLQLGFGPGAQINTHIPLPHALAHVLQGAGGEVTRIGQGLKQTVGGQTDPLLHAVSQQEVSTPGGKVGASLADTALTAPIGGAASSGLAKLGGLGARLAGNAFANAAIQGGLQGAITANPGQRWQGAGLGAALSPLAPLVGSGFGKLATGLARTPEAQTLLDRGVQLTAGQMNPGGLYNKLEQGMTALPLVGGKIANARGAAVPAFTRSVLKDALAPGDTLAPGNDVNALFDSAKQGFDNAYSQIHGYPMKAAVVRVQGADVPLADAFQQVTDKPRLGLTGAQRASMGQELQDQLNETLQVARGSGGLMSDHLQALRSAIRDAGRDVSPVDNASRAQKSFWDDAEQQVTRALDSQLPPKVAANLKAIDAQYGKLATVRAAIVAARDREGGPTLAQLSSAIKQGTSPSTYAAGGGWNRGALKAAGQVFGNNVPLTGLTGAGTVAPIMRGIEGGLGLGAGAVGAGHLGALVAHPLLPLATAGGLGGLYGAYTKAGLRALAGQSAPQRAVQGLLSSIHPAAREALSRYARAGLLSGLLGAQQQPGGLLGQ